ncbi:hypothetical protein F4818DRAFT_393742 [Hypoxylon cercidicola]|nr:hypothetical protein F4818DRAFT_393742 [Hypoxylon cercidicola]
MSPSQLTPLLGSSDSADYATIKPKRRLTVSREQPIPGLSANEDYTVNIEGIMSGPALSVSTYSHSGGCQRIWCDYCAQNNLEHFPEEECDAISLRRCMENEGSLAVLEALITFQMRLLSILVPLVLLFVLKIYMTGYIHER